MFTRKSDPTGPPPLPLINEDGSQTPRSPSMRPVFERTNSGVSIIGSDLVISGNMKSSGRVQFDGKLVGDLDAKTIVVGEGARIEGNLKGDDCHVCGTVVGTIEASKIVLHPTGEVTGDLVHKELTIDQGANFNGKSQRASF